MCPQAGQKGAGMKDKLNHVLEQYPVEVSRVTRVRGGYVIDTTAGLRLLSEYKGGLRRLLVAEELLHYLQEKGFETVDQIVRTKQDELTATDTDGTTYIMKCWYAGRECDYENRQDLFAGMDTLAKLHEIMQETNLPHGTLLAEQPHTDLPDLYLKRSREMKRVKQFISSQTRKTMFEYGLLQSFAEFFGYATEAIRQLEDSDYRQILTDARRRGTMIHGSYHYHNILVLRHEEKELSRDYLQAAATDVNAGFSPVAVTNFEKTDYNLQVADIYGYLRKVMEKNHWNCDFGKRLLDIYQRTKPLPESEKNLLKIQLLFPEKYWKLMNYYYNHTKAWIPEKNSEKLLMIRRQQEQKLKFIETIT